MSSACVLLCADTTHACMHASCSATDQLRVCGCFVCAGCILELDGCCYIAHVADLLQRLGQIAADTASWPAAVCFKGVEPQQMRPDQEGAAQQQLLQQQLQRLHAAVLDSLAASSSAAGQQCCDDDGGSSSSSTKAAACPGSDDAPSANGAAATAAAEVNGDLALQQQSWQLPIIHLRDVAGLPTMPTLNGFLLGYPVVYVVSDLQEAGVASRMLSAAQLKLHRLIATCAGQLSSTLLPDSGMDRVVLMSFTLPETVVESAGVEQKVQQIVQRLQERAQQHPGLWKGVEVAVMSVGPQAISL